MKAKTISSIVCTVVVFAFLVIGALQNISLLSKPLEKLNAEEIEYDGFIDEVQEAYTSDEFKNKEFYININGLFASLTGRNIYNDVVKMKNGQMSRVFNNSWDSRTQAKTLGEFNSYLKEIGVDFLYVQAPHKNDLTGDNLPVGVEDITNDNCDSFLANLRNNGIEPLDLRSIISPDAETVDKYFYKTDHHWNNDGAFVAYGQILSVLKEKFPEENIDMSYADINNWETTVYEDRFLGSLGKRVGIYYGGVDDYKLYLPMFETDMIFSTRQGTTIFRKGTFAEANVLKERYLEGEVNYFGDNTYCSYVGGDYPLVHYKNLLVENGLKVLVIKDSFTLPVQAFLSTAVSEMDVVDSRYFKDYSIAEYVELTRPDIVVMMVNPSVIADNVYYNSLNVNSAKEQQEASVKNLIYELDSVNITSPEEREFGYKVVFKDLEYNTKYVLTAEDFDIITGDVKGVTFSLYNSKTQRSYTSETFCMDTDCRDEGYVWSFVTPQSGEGQLQIIMYSGVAGDAGGNHLVANGLELFAMRKPE
ncbi:MAG: hypothetical protein E7673_07530 [Ruminococcaceae bacterium]|nr:hypothetical protein [Oscillospiraceae bacterium]